MQYNDPLIPTLPAMRRYPHLRMASQELPLTPSSRQDCVVIVTDHSAYDWSWIVETLVARGRYAKCNEECCIPP